MVHFDYHGVQYEAYLNRELDLYDVILPVCIDVRKMISITKIDRTNDYKLVILPYNELEDRFSKNPHFSKYIESHYTDFECTREKNPDAFKYYDAKTYNRMKKQPESYKPYTQEELKNCEKRLQEAKDNEDWFEEHQLKKVLNIQRMILNTTYFEEIKKIEHEMTDIELTDKEKEVISKVLDHPKLKGAIKWHGINFFDQYM